MTTSSANPVPTYPKMPDWPFFTLNVPYDDFDLNQSLSISLDDDQLRQRLIDRFKTTNINAVQSFPSVYHPDDNRRSRPYSYVPPGEHFKDTTWLVAGYREVREVLINADERYSNVPYAELGDRSFVLALDPSNTKTSDESARRYKAQRAYLSALMPEPDNTHLWQLANEATRHAVIAGLTRNQFDLADFAEQAAVRFCGLWFGCASTDHKVIQNAASASYRALVHLNIGKHFVSDPTVIPQAQAAMAELTKRMSELIAEYRKVKWQPRTVYGTLKNRETRAHWPEGVTPLDEWGLSGIGEPLLKRMAMDSDHFSIGELASMATGLIAGTVGNVQASVCTVIQQVFAGTNLTGDTTKTKSDATRNVEIALKAAAEQSDSLRQCDFYKLAGKLLSDHPPVPFLPRRAIKAGFLGGRWIEEGDEIILWLDAASQLKPGKSTTECQYNNDCFGFAYGASDTESGDSRLEEKPHSCIGKSVAHTLTTTIAKAVLNLDSVAEVIDPVSGKVEGLTRRWGFLCESYPLTYKRAMRVAQQPLNVIMRVKTPTDFHSSALQHIIYVGAPRVEKALNESGHVHFAWFQLLNHGQYLALHTVYDGDFNAYIQDFALKVDDLFDLLFEHVEGAPQLPVAENTGAFVNVINANNAPAVNGYFFSAVPSLEVGDIVRKS